MRQLLLKAVQISVFLFVLFGNIYFEWQLTGQLSALFALLAAIFSTAILIAIGDVIAWAKAFDRRWRPILRERLRRAVYRVPQPSITGFQGKPERDAT